MAALTEVTLHNFRGFERLEKMRLAPLTFLVGPNSSGKSSVADAVLFMAQSGFLSFEGTDPIWIGRLVDLGSFKDTVFRHDTSRAIEVRVRFDVGMGACTHAPKESLSSVDVAARLRTAKDSPKVQIERLSMHPTKSTGLVDLDIQRIRCGHSSGPLADRARRFDATGTGPLFIEHPEVHLHPRAQVELAQILCDASKKRQLVVETHSEHMVNRARRLVAEGRMKAKDVIIQYVDRDENGSHATTIELDDAGDFTRDWPDGFFDDRYRETMKIAEAQASRARPSPSSAESDWGA